LRHFWRRNYRAIIAFGILLLLFVTFLIVYPSRISDSLFATWANQGAGLALVAVGQTLVVLTSGIDMSIGSIFALSNCIASVFLNGDPYHLFLAIILVLGAGVFCGLLNGIVISYMQIQPIILTIATGAIYYGIALFIRPVTGGSVNEALSDALTYSVFHVPTSLILIFATLLLFWALMKPTKLYVGIYAIGSSEKSAFMSGVKVRQAKIAAYMFSGLFAAFGGLFLSLQTLTGDATIGMSYTLNSVAATVIGGTALTGGIGGIFGSVIGSYVLRTLKSIMFFAGIAPMAQPLFEGVVLMCALSIGSIRLLGMKSKIEIFR
jgi:ribose/xylose/arabinose/galactoside ABC-type transport system permease subunit